MDVGEGISGEGMSGSSLEKEHPGRPQQNLQDLETFQARGGVTTPDLTC